MITIIWLSGKVTIEMVKISVVAGGGGWRKMNRQSTDNF